MRIVIDIDDSSPSSARVSTDVAATPAAPAAGSGTGLADLATLQLSGTNAGPAPSRGGGLAATAAAPDSGPAMGADMPPDAGQSAGAAPQA